MSGHEALRTNPMLQTRFFDEPFSAAGGRSSSDKDPRLFQATQLAERGAYQEAAEIASALIDDGSRDIRAISYYLCGVFMEHGACGFGAILPRLARVLSDEMHTLTPENKRERVIDSALSWLFRVFAQQCLFHAAKKDDSWHTWVSQMDSAMLTEITSACVSLHRVLGDLVESPQSVAQLTRLQRCLKESMMPAVTRRERAEARRVAEEEQERAERLTEETEGENIPGAPAAPPNPVPARAMGSAVATRVAGEESSPALSLLIRKLQAFERLMAQQSMAKAAIVANDIREIIANFDPLVYLPKLFSNYFKLLSQSIDELMPYWHESESPTWQALDQFYRTDLERFVDE